MLDPRKVGEPVSPASFRLSVFRVPEGGKAVVRTLGAAYGGLLTHYRARSWYCADDDQCRLCRTHPDRIWKGYFACDIWDAKNRWYAPAVFELTEAAELDMRGRYERGQLWEFSRPEQTDRKKTPLGAKLVERLDPTTLPADFEFYAVLRTLYHVRHIDLGTPNPMPDRIMVQPTMDAPPAAAKVSPADQIETRTFREMEEELRKRGSALPSANGVNGVH